MTRHSMRLISTVIGVGFTLGLVGCDYWPPALQAEIEQLRSEAQTLTIEKTQLQAQVIELSKTKQELQGQLDELSRINREKTGNNHRPPKPVGCRPRESVEGESPEDTAS